EKEQINGGDVKNGMANVLIEADMEAFPILEMSVWEINDIFQKHPFTEGMVATQIGHHDTILIDEDTIVAFGMYNEYLDRQVHTKHFTIMP
ncbi:hypothetical protein KIPB_015818, partial [Kipferlia bialata]